MSDFRLPNSSQRISIMGHTGSGKTQFASWVLSQATFDRKPWIIVDYKYDDLLNQIPRLEELSLTDRIPKTPGLYVIHPLPGPINDDLMEDFLWRIWERENTGVYFDEGHMVPDRSAFRSLLTQGRSKRIPLIVLTQKPSWVCRFVFSEADFFSVFALTDVRDHKTVNFFAPLDLSRGLPKYHSHYYDVSRRRSFQLMPVPDRATLLERFSDRMLALKGRSWFYTAPRQRRA